MKTRPAFTLLELLIVMGMLVLFAGLAAAVSTPALRNAEFDRVRETVRSELAAARADTIGGTSDSSWGVAFSSGSITRYRGTSYATRDQTLDLVTTFGNGVTLSGDTDVTFVRPTGAPIAAATIIITNGALRATTTINAVGAIEMQ
ncbi:MAG: prepilin-type N-terminal cleavage/methylation domain-containing protein [Patescibacteria group bacterium]